MNKRLTDLGTSRRMFLAVIVVLVLVLGWVFTEEWRTGVKNHHLGTRAYFNFLYIERHFFSFSANELVWRYLEDGSGTLFSSVGATEWEFAPSTRQELNDVTPVDARRAAYESSPIPSGPNSVGDKLTTHVIRDGQIFLVRRHNYTQTVYAIQAVEQKDGKGHFRSRKILPAPGGSETP